MAKPVSCMTGRESWAAVGFQALARLLLLGVFLPFFAGSLCAKVPDKPLISPLFIVNEIAQKLWFHCQIPRSLLTEKVEKLFPNLEDQIITAEFHDACEIFVKECSQENALYLRSSPQDEALNTARPLVQFLEGRVAYLHLPAPKIQSNQQKTYILFIRKIVRRLSRRPLKGWVIDLRDCSGHDAKTLLAGCVDLFQEGPLGLIENKKRSLIQKFQNKIIDFFLVKGP